MNLFDTHYTRWEGKHTSIWIRRWNIALHGIRATLDGKLMKWLIGVSWSSAAMVCIVLFLIGQILIPENILESIGKQIDQVGVVVNGVLQWLNDNPDISISSIYMLVFFVYSWGVTYLSLIAVTKAIPHLMTQDIGSKSLIIYTSKAINKYDYVLGKISAMAGVLMVIWFLPCFVAWVFSNAFAPEWHFFWYSRDALIFSLTYFAIAIVTVSIMAVAFSAVSSNPRTTTGMWLGYWAVCWILEAIALGSPNFHWMRYASLRYNLSQIQQSVFNVEGYYQRLVEDVPGFSEILGNKWVPETPMAGDAMFGLIFLCAISLFFIFRKVDSES